MKQTTLLLPLALLACGLLAPDAATAQSPARPAATASASPDGFATGVWDLPGPGIPGDLSGRLFRKGRAVYEIDAVLVPDASGPGGSILGMARLLAGPKAGSLRTLKGRFSGGPRGRGSFQLTIFGPGPATGGPVPRVFLKGTYHDPNGPFLPLGAFQGHWKRR